MKRKLRTPLFLSLSPPLPTWWDIMGNPFGDREEAKSFLHPHHIIWAGGQHPQSPWRLLKMKTLSCCLNLYLPQKWRPTAFTGEQKGH